MRTLPLAARCASPGAKMCLPRSRSVSPDELQQYLHAQIPLSHAMAVRAVTVDVAAVVLAAPLAPNINHHRTVFGGSACAVATLASWGLLHTRLRADTQEADLVIQRNSMEFERPLAGGFFARAVLAEPQRWPQFLDSLQRRGKSRIGVIALLWQEEGEIAARFSGDFVATRARS
jgi:thioesterase domain-containing protein